jgi:hypothetical protein
MMPGRKSHVARRVGAETDESGKMSWHCDDLLPEAVNMRSGAS